MLGKTHIATGVATSLIIIHPNTVTGIIAAVAGGMFGDWICDLDCRESEVDEGAIAGFTLTAIFGTATLFLDSFLGNGICDYVVKNFGIKSVIGIILFLFSCVYGFGSSHRTFMHSIAALVITTLSISFFCMPIAQAYGIGFISHLLLDITNKRGLQLFFPLKYRLCMKVSDSDGKANDVIMISSIIVAVIMGALLFTKAIISGNAIELKDGMLLEISNFQWYLVIINILTFIVFCIDYAICMFTDWEKDQDFIHTILNLFALAGGAYGMLLSFIILKQKIGKHNANWYTIAISLVITWTVIICMVFNPISLDSGVVEKINIRDHLLILIYLVAINLVSVYFFFIDKTRTKWKTSELGLMLLGLAGGTVGGLVVMMITGKKSSSPHFSFGFPVMLAAQTVLLAYLLMAGII